MFFFVFLSLPFLSEKSPALKSYDTFVLYYLLMPIPIIYKGACIVATYNQWILYLQTVLDFLCVMQHTFCYFPVTD